MPKEERTDILVLGGGPGGYVAAIRSAQLGFKTVIVEKENLGGICLNWGCIPTKALLKSAELYDAVKNRGSEFGISFEKLSFDFHKIVKRSRRVSAKVVKGVEYLMRKNNIDYVKGFGKITKDKKVEVINSEGAIERVFVPDKIIIATGARPRTLPAIPLDGEKIITSKKAMTLENVPEEMVIVGAGAIGIEFAYFYSVLGTKVTIVEMLEHLLPTADEEISEILEKSFKKRKINFYLSAMVQSAEKKDGKVLVKIKTKEEEIELHADIVLNAVGVVGNTEGFGLEELGIEKEKSFIKVDRRTYATNVENIYAVGDVIGPPLLAHVASAEGIACVEGIKGIPAAGVDYSAIPACTYCEPQVASIGLTEKQAVEAGYEIKIGKFPYSASGKAAAIGEREGLVKLIFDKKYGELLGAHLIGTGATELIAEMGVAKKLEGDYESVFRTIHPHPTLSEMLMEAAANANDESIHI